MSNQQQAERMTSGKGFIAALDQSGGSTPKALRLYGIEDDAYDSEKEMFDLIHQMRSRIIMSPVFNGDRILGAILFEQTMDRDIAGKPSPVVNSSMVAKDSAILAGVSITTVTTGTRRVSENNPSPWGGWSP